MFMAIHLNRRSKSMLFAAALSLLLLGIGIALSVG